MADIRVTGTCLQHRRPAFRCTECNSPRSPKPALVAWSGSVSIASKVSSSQVSASGGSSFRGCCEKRRLNSCWALGAPSESDCLRSALIVKGGLYLEQLSAVDMRRPCFQRIGQLRLVARFSPFPPPVVAAARFRRDPRSARSALIKSQPLSLKSLEFAVDIWSWWCRSAA